MTPLEADREIAFVKKRRCGDALNKQNIASLIQTHVTQINDQQKALSKRVQIVGEQIVGDQNELLKSELERATNYRISLQKAVRTSQVHLVSALEKRDEMKGKVQSFQNTNWGKEGKSAMLLSHLSAFSASIGTEK